MNQYITGAVIKQLREARNMTQIQLAEILSVSDKTISKWETAKGYPDITIIEPLAAALNISVVELLSGSAVTNKNVSANMQRTKFYVCPVCGNVIHSIGSAVISCHGVILPPLIAEYIDDFHALCIQTIEDDYFISIEHEMTKKHYISFFAIVSCDCVQIIKLYPEGNAEVRFTKPRGKVDYYLYCNKDGLFKYKY